MAGPGFKNKLVLPALAGSLALSVLGFKLADSGHIILVYATSFLGLGFLYALSRMAEKQGQKFSRLESGFAELPIVFMFLRISEYHRQTSILMAYGSLFFLMFVVMSVYYWLLGRRGRS